jgi:hypothetical protein
MKFQDPTFRFANVIPNSEVLHSCHIGITYSRKLKNRTMQWFLVDCVYTKCHENDHLVQKSLMGREKWILLFCGDSFNCIYGC